MKTSWILALLCLAVPARAAGPGTTGLEVLRSGAGPRSFAMGEAMTAVPDGPFSLSANPAALSGLEYRELDLSYNRWVSDSGTQSLFYGHPAGFAKVALGISRRGVESFQGYDAGGLAVEKVSAQDWVVGVGLAKSLVKTGLWTLSLGAGAKGIDSRLEKSHGTGFAGDLGALADLHLSWAKLSAGLAAQNIGTGIAYDHEKTSLPTALRLGLAAQRRIYGDPFTLSVDVVKSQADPEHLKLAVGLEGGVSGAIFARIGFRSRNDLGNGLFFGLGLRIKNLQVDYGLSLLGVLGPAHRFGLGFKWGAPVEIARTQENLRLAGEYMEIGQLFMKQGRHLDAVSEFSKALNYDPTNPKILRKLKEAYDAMR